MECLRHSPVLVPFRVGSVHLCNSASGAQEASHSLVPSHDWSNYHSLLRWLNASLSIFSLQSDFVLSRWFMKHKLSWTTLCLALTLNWTGGMFCILSDGTRFPFFFQCGVGTHISLINKLRDRGRYVLRVWKKCWCKFDFNWAVQNHWLIFQDSKLTWRWRKMLISL